MPGPACPQCEQEMHYKGMKRKHVVAETGEVTVERALRHPVLWRRTSHGTQSDLGGLFVERILSVVETCRQQQRPVFDFLRQALFANRTCQPAPSLLPAS